MTDIVGAISACVELAARLYDYIEGVKGAPKNIAGLLCEVSTLRGILEDIRTRQPKGVPDHKLDDVVMKALVIIDGLRHNLHPKASWLDRQKQSLAWPFKEESIAKQIGVLRGINQSLMLIMINHLQSVPEALDEVKSIAHDTLKGVEEVHGLMKRETALRMNKDDLETRRGIISYLAPTSPDRLHADTCRVWEGSEFGLWLIEGTLKSWASDSATPVTLLCGGSGSGKTTLLSRVIEQQKHDGTQGTLAFFYCAYNEVTTQELSAVLGSWLVQLASTKPSILDRFKDQVLRKTTISWTDLEDAIVDIATSGPIILVLDALNESKESSELALAVTRLASRSVSIRFLISSTSDNIFTKHGCPCRRIDMESHLVGPDIEVYLRREIRKSEVLIVAGEDEILQALIRQADGNFMWASYQIECLKCIPLADQVMEASNRLPDTLDKTYASRLQRVLNEPPHWQIIVRQALAWLSYATIPLTLHELAEAVVIRGGMKSIGRSSRLLRPEELLDKCQNLVRWSPTSNLVTLAHGSIKTFLTGSSIRSSPVAYFALDAKSSLGSMILASLTYLLMDNFSTGVPRGRTELERYYKAYPLLYHASHTWPVYIRGCNLQNMTVNLILRLFETHRSEPAGGHFAFWIRVLMPDERNETIRKAHPLYYAASFGLADVVRIMLERNLVDLVDRSNPWYIDRPSGRHSSSALQVATYRNRVDTVKVLLEYGADPNSRDDAGVTCLQWAQMLGHSKLIPLLRRREVRDHEPWRDSAALTTAEERAAAQQEVPRYLLLF